MIDNKSVDYIRNDLKSMAASQLSRGLISDAGAELINRVADASTTDDSISVGEIRLPQHGGINLKRLFVVTGPGGQHILMYRSNRSPQVTARSTRTMTCAAPAMYWWSSSENRVA
jgi:hypothetical protein